MPPDTDPLIQNNDEKTHTNENLDSAITSPSQRQELADSMTAFFQEEDQKSGLPDSPDPEPAEKAEPKPKSEPRKKSKLEDVPAVDSDPDLDSLEPPKNASPATVSQFKTLKNIAKKFGAQSKTFRNKLSSFLEDEGLTLPDDPEQLGQVLEDWGSKVRTYKQERMTPEMQTEVEGLRQLGVAVGVLQDPEFFQQYQAPVTAAYLDAVDTMAGFFAGTKEEIDSAFTRPLKSGKFNPTNLPREWWDEQMDLMHCTTAERRMVENKVARVLELQENCTKKANEFTKEPRTFASWQQENAQKYQQHWESEVRDETMKFVNEKHPEWSDDIQNMTARGKDLDTRFRKLMVDANDARTRARMCAEYISMQEELASPEFRAWQKQKAQLKAEVTTRRRISDAPYKGGNGAGKIPAAPGSLPKDAAKSLKEAFSKHDWGDGSRK